MGVTVLWWTCVNVYIWVYVIQCVTVHECVWMSVWVHGIVTVCVMCECVYLWVYVTMSVWLCEWVCECIWMCVGLWHCVNLCVNVWTYECVNECVSMCVNMCMGECHVWVWMCECVYEYLWVRVWVYVNVCVWCIYEYVNVYARVNVKVCVTMGGACVSEHECAYLWVCWGGREKGEKEKNKMEMRGCVKMWQFSSQLEIKINMCKKQPWPEFSAVHAAVMSFSINQEADAPGCLLSHRPLRKRVRMSTGLFSSYFYPHRKANMNHVAVSTPDFKSMCS